MHSRSSYGRANVSVRALYAVPLQFLELWWIPRAFAVTVAQGRFNILKCHKMALTDSEAPGPGRPGRALPWPQVRSGLLRACFTNQLHSAAPALF